MYGRIAIRPTKHPPTVCHAPVGANSNSPLVMHALSLQFAPGDACTVRAIRPH